jgi:glycosyltransferase involved in cell wall biosynthesis
MAITSVRTTAPAASVRGAAGAPGLLCVANYPANTGYAWDFIESMYRGLADHFAVLGVRTWVSYPRLETSPRTLAGSAAEPLELGVELGSWRSVQRLGAFARRHRVKAIYFTDRPVWHPAYAALRWAGVTHIVVHDHTSGERTIPTGWKKRLKEWRIRVPGMLADRVVAVSDYVARRKVEVDLVPVSRVHRIWNSRPVVERDAAAPARLREQLRLGGGPVVVCACRATPEKGVAVLLRAFDRYLATSSDPAATLVYFGDGPAMPQLRELHQTLRYANRIVIAGYRADAADLLAGADVCVVPSLWQEAFGLAALEPMTYGIPVIASRVGGIPEVVIDGETGILTEPGDEESLESALRLLLTKPSERERLGHNGVRRARTHFGYDRALAQLIDVFEPIPGFR